MRHAQLAVTDNTDYGRFLEAKSQFGMDGGFEPLSVPDFLLDFQRALITWSLRKGRAAVFADCGLGKTPMQLVWADNVARKTNRPVLIVTPLAVSHQTVKEGEKFGIEVRRSDDGTARPGISVTNYERLHLFNRNDWAAVACDESSAIKNFNGVRRQVVTDFLRKMEYRSLWTATAAPNDFTELGTSSEALGYLGHMDMLGRFFKNDQNTVDTRRKWAGQAGPSMYQQTWRLKGHAEDHYWRWVSSWARACRKPSDIGPFDDAPFVLPKLTQREHLVAARAVRPGMLFDLPAIGLWEEREESRRTIQERCEMVADLVNGTGKPAVVWCHLNDEGNTLASLIPDAVEVSGDDSDDAKERAFIDFSTGQTRVLITKPKIGAWGLNWQHCAHMTFFPTHSFESFYQGVRRCWRFGQTEDVTVDIVTTEGGQGTMQNLQRKAAQADVMFDALIARMHNSLGIARQSEYSLNPEVPTWLTN